MAACLAATPSKCSAQRRASPNYSSPVHTRRRRAAATLRPSGEMVTVLGADSECESAAAAGRDMRKGPGTNGNRREPGGTHLAEFEGRGMCLPVENSADKMKTVQRTVRSILSIPLGCCALLAVLPPGGQVRNLRVDGRAREAGRCGSSQNALPPDCQAAGGAGGAAMRVTL